MADIGTTKVKICGLRTGADVQIVNEARPDFCGFIFVPGRKRYIEPEAAAHLVAGLDQGIRPVGVFVDAALDEILGTIRTCHLDMVQLHGRETDEDVEKLRGLCSRQGIDITIVKAFRIDTEEDMKKAEKSVADFILLDHGIGGTGESFDWSLIRDCGRDFFLAGGLSAENVGRAIRLAKPWAVDASSSLETDGHKDPEKVRAFMEAVRNSTLY